MNAFGLLLWCVALALLALVYGLAILINGVSPQGWSRTTHFYVLTSLLTLPAPLWLLTRTGAPPVSGLWVIAAALRLMMCVPFFALGSGLAALAVRQKRPFAMLVATALLNLGSFAYLYLRAL